MLSGAAGLIFEVVWARQLVLVFGNTTQAISAILTGFFGGLAAGSWIGGRLADRVYRPLRLYGLLELTLVVVVLFTPVTFGLIHQVYRSAFEALQTTPRTLALVRFGLALVALAPATILMGATLPTLTRYLATEARALSPAFARLYLANTRGAIFGAAIAGLVLIELLGLFGALLVGASCAALAGVVALAVDVWSELPATVSLPRPLVDSSITPPPATLRLALIVAFFSGLTSLAYQTLWMRLISSGTGNSTYVFTLILAIFLTGLAMGAVEYRRIQSRARNVVPLLAIGQIAIGVLVTAGMYFMISLDQFPPSSAWKWKTFVIVLPATYVMGFCFPAASALLGGSNSQVGARSGLLLAANTVGAIVGTFVVPFVIIPLAGSPTALGLVVIVNVLLGSGLAIWGGGLTRTPRIVIGVGGAAAAMAVTVLLATGLVFVDPAVARLRHKGAQFRAAEDEIASVQAIYTRGHEELWVNGNGMTSLTVDTKLMPLLPLSLRPASTTLLVIAFGMGSSYRTALIAGLNTDAVDLVPSVPRMFDAFFPDARSVLANKNGRIIIADGRNYVELTRKTYDIIVVDPPPPPQSAGVSIISSREFYRAARAKLTHGGVMMQWVTVGQTIEDFRAHVRTFRDIFPHVIVAEGPGGWGFYMLGSALPISFDQASVRAMLSRPGVLRDISSMSDSPETSLDGWCARIPALVLLSGPEVGKFAGSGPLVTDDRPLPEYDILRHAFNPPSPHLEPGAVRATALR